MADPMNQKPLPMTKGGQRHQLGNLYHQLSAAYGLADWLMEDLEESMDREDDGTPIEPTEQTEAHDILMLILKDGHKIVTWLEAHSR